MCITVRLPPLELYDFFDDVAAVKVKSGSGGYEIVPCFYDGDLGNPENIYRLRCVCGGAVVLSHMTHENFHEHMIPESKKEAVRLLYSAEREYNTG